MARLPRSDTFRNAAMTQPPRILFVCLGNICRSPMAEGVARKRFAEAGLAAEIDSAGLGDWHAGEAPDRRAVNASWRALVDLSSQRARQIEPGDFARFDHVLAVDEETRAALQDMAPEGCAARIRLLMDFAGTGQTNIPDPYYGGHEGFDDVLEMIDAAIAGLIVEIGGT